MQMVLLSPNGITQLLIAWRNGNQAALDKLIPLVENELRRLASKYMRRERSDHTLQTTALVNEAYIRLADQKNVDWQNRTHFFAIAAQLMRRILIDYAKTHYRTKRGGNADKISFDEAMALPMVQSAELLLLDEALNKLAAFDARKSQVVEMRYFGGLSIEETAEVLKISVNTVSRDWHLAKAWLRREMEAQNQEVDDQYEP